MKTQASYQALKNQIESGKLRGDKKRIMRLFEQKKYISIRYVMIVLNLPHRTVSARLSDLNDLGLIHVSKKDKDSKNSLYKLSENPELIRKFREEQKIKRMINKLTVAGYEVVKK